MTAVLDRGPAAADALLRTIADEPTAPGVEAATAVLGRLGGTAARAYLAQTVDERLDHAAFAALALGDCGTAAEKAVLQAAADDRLADPLLRAGAAASLLRLGERRSLRNLVRGILLAGTPSGREHERALGLPHKPRWAYERHLLQLAFLDTAGTDFGLDTDAPWDELARVADRVDQWLARDT